MIIFARGSFRRRLRLSKMLLNFGYLP
jgi:hypothetical protein